MSKGKKSQSWWDIALWVGLFLLIIVFLYQLLKLWQAGQVTAQNFVNSISQAAGNTVAAVESGFQSLFTSPGTFLSGLLALVPSFFTLGISFLGSFVLGDALTGIFNFISSLFNQPAAAIAGAGSSDVVTGNPPADAGNNNLSTNSTGQTFSITSGSQ